MPDIYHLWHAKYDNGDAYALFKKRENADKYVDVNPGSEVISLMVIDTDS